MVGRGHNFVIGRADMIGRGDVGVTFAGLR